MRTEATVTPARHEVLLGRQPIFDRQRSIHAFELLFRGTGGVRGEIDGNTATANVLLNALVEIGVNNLSTGELLFVNCTRDAVMAPCILPPERTVLELLEDIELDEAIVTRMRELRQQGYRIALDDFIWHDSKAAAVAEADYIKLDVRQLSPEELQHHCKILDRYHARIIAEKVESEAELQFCQKLGIDLFQGYYLRKPELLRRRTMPTSCIAALRVVSQCKNPDIALDELARTISADIALTWGLLRLANTLLYSGSAPVETISQAVARLGTQKLMRWAVLLTIAGQPDCPRGYLQISLLRAFMCERVAMAMGFDSGDTVFLVGLLSALDSIVDMPMDLLVKQLPVADKVKHALVEHAGPVGRILKAVVAWERGDWHEEALGAIPRHVAMEAWLYSLGETSATLKSLAELGTRPLA